MNAAKQSEDRRSGRPRSARADDAIRKATIQALLANGYSGLSIEGVAAASGVAKTTIYRRFAGKAELVADAIGAQVGPPPRPDTGSFAGDMRETFRQAFTDERVALGGIMLPRLLGDAAHHPELRELLHRVLLQPRRKAAREAIERGVDRGELRSDLDVEDMIDALVGPVTYRVMITGGDPEAIAGFPDRVLDLVLAGIATR